MIFLMMISPLELDFFVSNFALIKIEIVKALVSKALFCTYFLKALVSMSVFEIRLKMSTYFAPDL
jgi:hypothetical protein